MLVTLSPFLLLIAGLLWLLEGGPIIYRHPRIGYGGRVFNCLKFRTMCVNGDRVLEAYFQNNPAAAAEWAITRKLKTDPRVSLLGRMLRETSIDELPQLFNVIRGDMSCVGPRPITADELCRYEALVGVYLSTRPGLTGAWQVGGRNETSYAERVALDVKYVQSWSLRNDLKIIVRTPRVVVSRRGSY
ncbi:sugar transferase [Bradyrhizobium japonicum]|nr:sugar transferase [Bradyrhizobium japonicum]